MRHHVALFAAAGAVLATTALTACGDDANQSSPGAGTGAGSVTATVTDTAAQPSGSAPATASIAGSQPNQTAAGDVAGTTSPTVTTKAVPLGKILVTDKGLSLYLFLKDKTSTSTCSGACAQAWPPLVVKGKPTAAGGVQGKLLSTSKRSDGSMQVTYNGHPLYRFAGDTKAGDLNGQGLNNFGAKWYVLGTDGKQITAASPTQKPSGGGY